MIFRERRFKKIYTNKFKQFCSGICFFQSQFFSKQHAVSREKKKPVCMMLTCAASLHCRSKIPSSREGDAECVWLSNHHKEAWRNVWNLLLFFPSSLLFFKPLRNDFENLVEQVSTGFAFQPDWVGSGNLKRACCTYESSFLNSDWIEKLTLINISHLREKKRNLFSDFVTTRRKQQPVVKRSFQKATDKMS